MVAFYLVLCLCLSWRTPDWAIFETNRRVSSGDLTSSAAFGEGVDLFTIALRVSWIPLLLGLENIFEKRRTALCWGPARMSEMRCSNRLDERYRDDEVFHVTRKRVVLGTGSGG